MTTVTVLIRVLTAEAPQEQVGKWMASKSSLAKVLYRKLTFQHSRPHPLSYLNHIQLKHVVNLRRGSMHVRGVMLDAVIQSAIWCTDNINGFSPPRKGCVPCKGFHTSFT